MGADGHAFHGVVHRWGWGHELAPRGPTRAAAESGSSGITVKVSAALKAGEIMLLFLLSKAKEIEAVHIYIHTQRHTHFPQQKKQTENFLLLQHSRYNAMAIRRI